MQQRNQKPANQPTRDDEAFTLPPQVEAALWADAYRKHLRPCLIGDEAELAALDRAVEMIELRVFERADGIAARGRPKQMLSA